MSRDTDSSVICPFYTCEPSTPKTRIQCEGTESDNHITLCFVSQLDRDSYKDRYCRHWLRWENCPIAIGLNSKY